MTSTPAARQAASEAGDVRQRLGLDAAEEPAVAGLHLGLGQVAELAAVAAGAEVLHVDDEERGALGDDGDVAGGQAVEVHAQSPVAAARASARSAVQRPTPAASAIRSLRISMSTCGRPRRSPCTGMV